MDIVWPEEWMFTEINNMKQLSHILATVFGISLGIISTAFYYEKFNDNFADHSVSLKADFEQAVASELVETVRNESKPAFNTVFSRQSKELEIAIADKTTEELALTEPLIISEQDRLFAARFENAPQKIGEFINADFPALQDGKEVLKTAISQSSSAKD